MKKLWVIASVLGFSITLSSAVSQNNILTIGSEFIYVNAVDVSGLNVSDCLRGFGSTAAVAHGSGAAFTASDNIHQQNSGYAIWASTIVTSIQANGWTK